MKLSNRHLKKENHSAGKRMKWTGRGRKQRKGTRCTWVPNSNNFRGSAAFLNLALPMSLFLTIMSQQSPIFAQDDLCFSHLQKKKSESPAGDSFWFKYLDVHLYPSLLYFWQVSWQMENFPTKHFPIFYPTPCPPQPTASPLLIS